MSQDSAGGSEPRVAAREALERLLAGNRRFVAGEGRGRALADPRRRAELAHGQRPFAVVLGCSDSRVPAEIVFDQGLGDLFVIRIAGNIVSDSQIGSVEFAIEELGARLVVVLGHSRCGAVLATLRELASSPGPLSPGLGSIVDRIRPAVEPLLAAHPGRETKALLPAAVRANVRHSLERLRSGSELIAALAAAGELGLIGAEYSLDTGEVEVFVGADD